MPYVVNVGYPSAAGARFDMSYYVNKHMPMVQRVWSQNGLQSWYVTKHEAADSPYGVQAVLFFKDKAGWEEASTKNGEEVFADIPSYTDLKPALYHGEQVGGAQV